MLLGRGHNNWGFVTSRKEKPITRRSCLQIRAVMTAWKICFPRLPKPGGKISRSVRIFWKKSETCFPVSETRCCLERGKCHAFPAAKEILTDFPAPPQTEVEICHVDPALSEYLAPAFYITAPIDDISHNRIYINDAKNDTDIYYFTTLAHEGYPGHLYQTICTSSYGAPEVRSSSTILVTPKAGQPTPKCRLFIMPDLTRILPPCYSTTRLQHSVSMPLRISGFIILDGKRKKRRILERIRRR